MKHEDRKKWKIEMGWIDRVSTTKSYELVELPKGKNHWKQKGIYIDGWWNEFTSSLPKKG